jgi:hypothetical protein
MGVLISGIEKGLFSWWFLVVISGKKGHFSNHARGQYKLFRALLFGVLAYKISVTEPYFYCLF